MRVLHIIEGLAPWRGGLSRAPAHLSQALRGRGIDGEIITTTLPKDGEIFQPEGVEVQAFPRKVLRAWGYAPHMSQAIKAAIQRADLIHVHGLWCYPHLVSSRAAWDAHKPYVVCPHGMLDEWALSQGRFKKRIYANLIEWQTLRRAAVIHALGESEAANIKRLGITTQVVTIPNGVDEAEFDQLPDREVFIKKHPMLGGKTIFLFLGRIHPKKGVTLLAKAFAEVARARPDVALVVAGPDEVGYLKEMEACMDAEGAAGRYVFTGLLAAEDRMEALAAADVFILPSYSEGFPIAPIEALAAGVPVIVTAACNIPGIEEQNVGLISTTEVSTLSQAMIRLADNPALRKQMGANGRTMVSNTYTWDRIAAQMTTVYQNILRGSNGSSPGGSTVN
jgi:glycosyltransferase involved in cell wall biosynthesis